MELYSRSIVRLSHGSIKSCARHLFYLVRSQYSDMHYCIMVSKSILILCLVVVNYSYSTMAVNVKTNLNTIQTIQILIKEFQMKHPIIITAANSITIEEISLLKFLHQNGNFCNMCRKIRTAEICTLCFFDWLPKDFMYQDFFNVLKKFLYDFISKI